MAGPVLLAQICARPSSSPSALAAPFPGLACQGPREPHSAARPQGVGAADVDLDGPHARGAGPCGRLCRPDDLRGLSPVSVSAFTVRIATSIEAIGREAWDACANPGNAACASPPVGDEPDVEAQAYHPFVSYDFLHALEKSGSVGGRSGWTPLHIVATSSDGEVAAAMPAYAKTHSQGEYVFDWGWAEAYERAGGRYYPKLQVSIPFTPATGRRFLIRNGVAPDAARAALLAGAKAALDTIQGSSIHATFVGRADWERLAA